MYLTEQVKPQKPEQTLFQKSDNDEPGLAQTGRLSCGRKVQWEDFHSSSQQSRTSGGPVGSARLAACTCQNCIAHRGLFATPRAASEATALVCVPPLQEHWPEQEQSVPTHLFQEVPCIQARHLCKAACVLCGQEQEGRAGQSTPAELGLQREKARIKGAKSTGSQDPQNSCGKLHYCKQIEGRHL